MADAFNKRIGETCANTGLDFSTLPTRDVSFKSATESVVDCGLNLPQSVDALPTLKFPLTESQELVDGLQLRLRCRWSIRKSDGTKYTTDRNLAPVAGLAGTSIEKLELWQGGRPLAQYQMYMYIYHVLNLLHRPSRWFKTLGSANAFLPDTKTADPAATWKTNKGLEARREMAQRSKEFETVDTLFLPPFLQERLLPTNGFQWNIQLTMNKSQFSLFKKEDETGDYKLYLLKAELLVTSITLSPSAEQVLNRTSQLVIPYTDFQVNVFSLFEGLLQRSLPTTTLGSYPKRFYIFFTSQTQTAGDIKTNPFIYGNHNVESIRLNLGGRIFETFDLDFSDQKLLAITAYHNLVYRALGKSDGDTIIDVKTWGRMYTIICFDVTNSRFSAECPMLSTPNQESVGFSISVKFREKLSEPLQLMVLTESERVLSLSKDGQTKIY